MEAVFAASTRFDPVIVTHELYEAILGEMEVNIGETKAGRLNWFGQVEPT
jgi:hypothetical protein